MSQSLNIVSFDVPFPPNYGGVIDVYYKLVALKAAGVKVHLHAFEYGRKTSAQLEALCEKVYYYPRKTGLLANLSLDPYTVKSRQSVALETNLLSNDFPILFEVLHTCYLMDDVRFKHRKKIYRHSNIEHDYYNELSRSEKSITKKLYLKLEAIKLERFESILNHADLILAVNKRDTEYFKKKFPKVHSEYLPSFHANSTSTSKLGSNDYVLFHGNLAISENYEAVLWLAEHVFSKLEFKVIVAGLNPPTFLLNELAKYSNIKVKASPNEEEMIQLIRNAQVHVLWTSQPTGLKLKLLNVLFKGRFVVCNPNMLAGTEIGQSQSLFVCDTAADFIEKINACLYRDYTEALNQEREKVTAAFSNATNVQRLIRFVFGKH
jgi:hypothetical protein